MNAPLRSWGAYLCKLFLQLPLHRLGTKRSPGGAGGRRPGRGGGGSWDCHGGPHPGRGSGGQWQAAAFLQLCLSCAHAQCFHCWPFACGFIKTQSPELPKMPGSLALGGIVFPRPTMGLCLWSKTTLIEFNAEINNPGQNTCVSQRKKISWVPDSDMEKRNLWSRNKFATSMSQILCQVFFVRACQCTFANVVKIF